MNANLKFLKERNKAMYYKTNYFNSIYVHDFNYKKFFNNKKLNFS